MALNFHKCKVSVSGISGYYLLAESASIDENNNLSPLYSIGYSGPIKNNIPINPIKNSFRISYFLESPNEPNYYLSNSLKNYNTSIFPIEIIVGGITGDAYLDNYSIEFQENELVKTNVEYSIYNKLRGNKENQIFGFVSEDMMLDYPGLGGFGTINHRGSGLAHSWTTYCKSFDNLISGNVLSLNYNFRANWQPIYKIGSSELSQIELLNSQETFNFVTEYNLHTSYSGEFLSGKIPEISVIEINPLSGLNNHIDENNKLFLYPGSGTVTYIQTEIKEGDIITSQINVIKNY